MRDDRAYIPLRARDKGGRGFGREVVGFRGFGAGVGGFAAGGFKRARRVTGVSWVSVTSRHTASSRDRQVAGTSLSAPSSGDEDRGPLRGDHSFLENLTARWVV